MSPIYEPSVKLTIQILWKSPLTPFPHREGRKFKVSLLEGERNRREVFQIP
jgi:hypothetical protein